MHVLTSVKFSLLAVERASGVLENSLFECASCQMQAAILELMSQKEELLRRLADKEDNFIERKLEGYSS